MKSELVAELRAARRQMTRQYLCEATTLVWQMQRALVEPGPDDPVPAFPCEMEDMARRLRDVAGIVEGMAAAEGLLEEF